MARQALRLCEALLQSVAALDGAPQGLEGIALAGQRQQQLLPQQQQQQQQQQHHKAHKYIEDIRSLTALHNNAWKKLLRERQVPMRLAMLCCSDSSDLSLRQVAAVKALDALIAQAAQSDWYKSDPRYGTHASSLFGKFAVQLQQSGLLQQLPGLLSTAAAQLDAVQDKHDMLASMLLPRHADLVHAGLKLPFVSLLQEHTIQLLQVVQHLKVLLPVGSTAPAGALPPEVVLAGQRLQLAAVAHTCRCLEHLPDHAAPGVHFEALPQAAFVHLWSSNQVYAWPDRSPTGTSNCCTATVQAHTPQQQQMACQLRASCTMLLLALCQEHSCKHLPELQQCSSAPDYTEQNRAIWQYACTHHSQLPPPYLHLCRALGYGSRALLFVACSYSRVSEPLSMLVSKLSSGLGPLLLHVQQLEEESRQLEQVQQQVLQLQAQTPQQRDLGCPQPQQQEEKQADQQQQQQQQHEELEKEPAEPRAGRDAAALLLLPNQAALAVVHWAAAQPLSRLGSDAVVEAGLNLAAHMLKLTQLLGTANTAIVQPLELAVPESRQQQHDAGQAMSEQHSSHCASSQGGMPLQGWWLAGEDLDQVLALLTKLTRKLSMLPAADAAAVAAGQSASVDECSSSSGSSTAAGSTMLLPGDTAPGNCQHIMFATTRLVMRLQVHVAAPHSAELLATGHSQHSTAQHGTAQLSTGSNSWTRHLRPLLRLTEAAVRASALHSEPQNVLVLLLRLLRSWDPDGLAVASYRDDPAQGPDSPAALSLFSICCTLLKVLGINRKAAGKPPTPLAQHMMLSSVLALCDISFGKLSLSVPRVDEAPSQESRGSTDDDAGSSPDLDSHQASSSTSSSSSTEVVSILPWLVLLGRCCLEVALELQQPDALHVCQEVLSKDLADSLRMCFSWLQAGSNTAQLAAAGFKPAGSVHMLLATAVQHKPATTPGSTAAAVDNTQAADSDTTAAAAASDDTVATNTAWAQQLHSLGLSLNTLAISCACNNPYCCSIEGLSELQLVKGRARLCAKCRVARYCSKACQAQHWKHHKPACKALEAARQAQGSAGPAAAAVGCQE